MYKKDIERLLNTIKVDDSHILLGDPIEIEKYGIIYKINQLNWWKDWEKYTVYLGMFLQYYSKVCESFKFPMGMEDVETLRQNFRLTISNKIFGHLAFRQLCNIARLTGANKKAMKEKFTVDDYFELFL